MIINNLKELVLEEEAKVQLNHYYIHAQMSSASSSAATTSHRSGSGESTKHMTKAHSTTTSPTSESGCAASSNSSNSVGQKLLTLLKISRNQGSGESHSESISGGDYENKSAPASGYHHHHNHHHHSSNTAAASANAMSASIGMQQRVMSQSLSQTKLMMLSQDDGGVYKGPTDD